MSQQNSVFLVLLLIFHLEGGGGLSHWSNVMFKRVLSNSKATCNDGSRAVFYVGPQDPGKWVIFLESGKYCSSETECLARFADENTKHLMTSKHMPDSIEGRDLLSAVKKDNPLFYDFSHVLIPYCSSDLWLGTSEAPRSPSKDTSQNNFTFSGKTIFRSVISELLNANLRQASEIVLIGSSAGAVGVLNNVEPFTQTLISRGLRVRVSAIIDGGWFINFRESLSSKFHGSIYTGIVPSGACADFSHGYPCCFSAWCMLNGGYYPSSVATLFVLGLYDIYNIGDVLRSMVERIEISDDGASDLLTLVSTYGGAMNQSLGAFSRNQSNVSYYVPACSQHTFFSMSSLRDQGQLLHYSKVIAQGSTMFNLTKQSGAWSTVAIPGGTKNITLQAAVEKWFTSRDQPVRMIDSCLGVLCNPTCPDKLTFIDSADNWNELLNSVALIVSLVPTVVCVVLRIIFIFQLARLREAQKGYLDILGTRQTLAYEPVEAVTLAFTTTNNILGSQQNAVMSQERTNRAFNAVHEGDSTSDDPKRFLMAGSKGNLMDSCFNEKDLTDKLANVCFKGGELVAIVGLNRSGKSTFLSLLSGRLTPWHSEESLVLNGVTVKSSQAYASKVGCVKSSTEPYCGDLTLRQYVFLIAHMRLANNVSNKEKFDRVEEVISQLGLGDLADRKLNNSLNKSITPVQMRLLTLAPELVTRPFAIFMDDPIAGLDFACTLELLNTLKLLCSKNLLVVMTSQLPSEEVAQEFSQIVILCDKQIIYNGTPPMLSRDFGCIQGGEGTKNTPLADVISDIVNCEKTRLQMMQLFQNERQPDDTTKEMNLSQKASIDSSLTLDNRILRAGLFTRLFVMDSLVSKSLSIPETLYLSAMFTIFGLTAGIVFWQANSIIAIITSYSGSTIPSLLFISSVLISRVKKGLEIHEQDFPRSVDSCHEPVIHTFLNMSAACVIPVVMCSLMAFVMVMTVYDWWRLFLVTAISLVLNQAWIAMYMLIILANQRHARHACLFAAILGSFAAGFIVTQELMPIGYNLLFYINPQFYGFSAIIKVLLRDVRLHCEYESRLNCISADGNAVLARFEFSGVNPFRQLLVLQGICYLCLFFSGLLVQATSRCTHFHESCLRSVKNLLNLPWSTSRERGEVESKRKNDM